MDSSQNNPRRIRDWKSSSIFLCYPLFYVCRSRRSILLTLNMWQHEHSRGGIYSTVSSRKQLTLSVRPVNCRLSGSSRPTGEDCLNGTQSMGTKFTTHLRACAGGQKAGPPAATAITKVRVSRTAPKKSPAVCC